MREFLRAPGGIRRRPAAAAAEVTGGSRAPRGSPAMTRGQQAAMMMTVRSHSSLIEDRGRPSPCRSAGSRHATSTGRAALVRLSPGSQQSAAPVLQVIADPGGGRRAEVTLMTLTPAGTQSLTFDPGRRRDRGPLRPTWRPPSVRPISPASAASGRLAQSNVRRRANTVIGNAAMRKGRWRSLHS